MTLSVNALSYDTPDGFNAKLSFQIQSAERVGLIGINGAGKSTLFRVLSGETSFAQGDITLNNHSLTSNRHQYLSQLGVMMDQFPSSKQLSVYDVLSFAKKSFGHASLKNNDSEVISIQDIASQFFLTDFLRKRLSSLSLGERQRVSLAQALFHQPSLLLLDEPLNGLDPAQQSNFWQVLNDYSQDAGVLIASHSMSELLDHCHRLLVIHHHDIKLELVPQTHRYLFFFDDIPTNTNVQFIHPKVAFCSTEEEHQQLLPTFNKAPLIHGQIQHALPMMFRFQSSGEWQW